MQIDDGWQKTYGAWWPNDRFPADLGELVRELRGLGCRAGLWLAPFRVEPVGPGIAVDHPDWCLRDADGAPLREDRHGTWALDASHPDACAWMRDLGAQVRAWGFEMVKVDFCYLGALEAVRHDPRVTGVEALRRGFEAFVDGLGPDVYVLGCGMPTLPAVGICHANRVGHDLAMPRVHQELGHPVDDGWTGFTGVRAEARNVAARWAQAGRWYEADPEVVMAWGGDGTNTAGYPTETARALATMVALTGGPFLLADDLTALTPAERAVIEHPALLELVERAGAPGAGGAVGARTFRPVDLFERADPPEIPEHVYTQGTRDRVHLDRDARQDARARALQLGRRAGTTRGAGGLPRHPRAVDGRHRGRRDRDPGPRRPSAARLTELVRAGDQPPTRELYAAIFSVASVDACFKASFGLCPCVSIRSRPSRTESRMPW